MTLGTRELLDESRQWFAMTRDEEPMAMVAIQRMDLDQLEAQVQYYERLDRHTGRGYMLLRERLVGYCVKQRMHHHGNSPDQG